MLLFYIMIRSTVLLAIFAFTFTWANAQKDMYKSNLDSIEVLHIVKIKRLLYIDKNLTEEEISRTPVYQPKVTFNNKDSIWLVSSTKYKTTRRGKCRKTNGCTIVTTMHVEVDDRNGKILSKRKEITKLPNYE